MQELEELLCQLAAPMNSIATTVVEQARGTCSSMSKALTAQARGPVYNITASTVHKHSNNYACTVHAACNTPVPCMENASTTYVIYQKIYGIYIPVEYASFMHELCILFMHVPCMKY